MIFHETTNLLQKKCYRLVKKKIKLSLIITLENMLIHGVVAKKVAQQFSMYRHRYYITPKFTYLRGNKKSSDRRIRKLHENVLYVIVCSFNSVNKMLKSSNSFLRIYVTSKKH